MAKYNINEKKEKVAAYRSLVSPKMMDEMQEKIMNIIVMQKKYRDKDYSAKKLAEELGTNTRYISAIVNVRFHMNYTSFVNKYRMEEVSDMVGFSNRQSFYASFFRVVGITPREYRLQHLKQHPSMLVPKPRKTKAKKTSAKSKTKAKAKE